MTYLFNIKYVYFQLIALVQIRGNSMVRPSSCSTYHTKVIYSHNITMSLVKYNFKSTTHVVGKIYTWFVCDICIQTLLFQSKFLFLSPMAEVQFHLMITPYCSFFVTMWVKVLELWTWVIKFRSYVCFWSYLETMLNYEFKISFHKKKNGVIRLGGGLNRMEGWCVCLLQCPSQWLQ